MDVSQTTALVTGAGSGLGAACCAALAAAGAHVVGLDLQEPSVAVAGVDYRRVDVTDAGAVQQAVDVVGEPGRPLRIAVSCAGRAVSMRIVGRAGPHDPQVFADVVRVNLIGTFNVMTAAATVMARTEPDAHGQRGVVVNTASIAAFDGQVGQAAYAASKGGVVALTLPAARDLAQHGIRVCAVAPGIVDTPMMAGFPDDVRAALAASVPFPARLGRPEEFAALVLAIIGNDYLNGEVIRLDGALRMPPR